MSKSKIFLRIRSITGAENLGESKKIQNRLLLELEPGKGLKQALKYK
jgi:hypothetical protein